MIQKGIITKGIGGFYYVRTPLGLVECKARGKFRKEKLTPAVGDHVTVDVYDESQLLGSIDSIAPRKNSFVRPPVSNIDQMLVTMAGSSPAPDLMLVDKLLATALHEEVACVICINKIDITNMADVDAYRSIYEKAGFPVLCVSATQQEGLDDVRALLHGKVTALSGNSGVGKSSLLNALGCRLETGAVSDKIHRGRHTTRHVELLELSDSTYVLDTPGFSSYEVDYLRHSELETLWPEFASHLGQCRFAGCTHINEPDCAVKAALEAQEIAPSRYQNYVTLYNQLKEIKEWMR